MASKRVSNEAQEPVDAEFVPAPAPVIQLTLDQIRVDEAKNLRKFPVAAERIRELADNIKRYGGLLEPLIVERIADEKGEYNGDNGETHDLVAGYQRYRALAVLEAEGVHIPITATLKPDGADPRDVNLDENLRRNDLSYMDVAYVAQSLIQEGAKKQDVAKRFGKKPGWISHVLKFLTLRAEIQEKIHRGEISFRVARVLPDLNEKEQDRLIASLHEGEAREVQVPQEGAGKGTGAGEGGKNPPKKAKAKLSATAKAEKAKKKKGRKGPQGRKAKRQRKVVAKGKAKAPAKNPVLIAVVAAHRELMKQKKLTAKEVKTMRLFGALSSLLRGAKFKNFRDTVMRILG